MNNEGTRDLQVCEVHEQGEEIYDDLPGEILDRDLVKRARQDEMQDIFKHGVYEKVNIEECWEKTGADPIGARWVDVNKGDSTRPEYRSRLVAQETKGEKREDLFAAAPPFEAKKVLFSLAVSLGETVDIGLDFIDVRRAYFHAPARRAVYVRLPPRRS